MGRIDELLNTHTDREIAERLNGEGFRSGWGQPFHAPMVARLRNAYGLPARYERLRERGMLSEQEIAQALDISKHTVKMWRRCWKPTPVMTRGTSSTSHPATSGR